MCVGVGVGVGVCVCVWVTATKTFTFQIKKNSSLWCSVTCIQKKSLELNLSVSLPCQSITQCELRLVPNQTM